METLKAIGQVLVVILIVGGVVATMTHRWQSKFTQANLAKGFFWFGVICIALAIFTQYGDAYQIGTPDNFAGSAFYLLLGIAGMLGGIYLNTEKKA